jgi:hypothetical protein
LGWAHGNYHQYPAIGEVVLYVLIWPFAEEIVFLLKLIMVC